MGGPAERIRHDLPPGSTWPASTRSTPSRSTVAGPVAQHLATGLPDALFEHDGQLTRREMRAVTLSTLAPRRGELLWDVGGGAGSIGIEWMLRHPANRAIAIEPDAARAARIGRNAAALGVPALAVVAGRRTGRAGRPAAAGRRVPRRRGAPARRDRRRLGRAAARTGALVANAVTMETEAALLAAQARLGGTLLRLSLERLDAVGPMHAFRPAMTVTQWAAVKP